VLFESEIVEVVCAELQYRGYRIEQKLETTQHGIDIIAVKNLSRIRKLYIEAKGETSSARYSKRYGKPFNVGQIRTHVAVASHKSAEVLSVNQKDYEVRVGIALPENEGHLKAVERIQPILDQLGIAIFWVNMFKLVRVVSPWSM